jgi:glycosyltransferase involved in cell wall biosynthesis
MISDYDVVHYHCLGPALFSFLPRLAGKKTVVTVQGLDWQRGKWGRIAARVLRWGEAAAVSLPDATMVVSRTLQQYYRQQYDRDTIYVPNGATSAPRRMTRQLTEWGLLPNNYVLFLGRLSPEKNCHLLIKAFENLQTDMKLVLAGGSSHSDSYVRSLRRHESDQIRFLPWVSGNNLEELLGNAALFVLPSELEGLSLASRSVAATWQILSACSTCSCAIPNFAVGPQTLHASGFRASISGPKLPARSKKLTTTCSDGARTTSCPWNRPELQLPGSYLWIGPRSLKPRMARGKPIFVQRICIPS